MSNMEFVYSPFPCLCDNLFFVLWILQNPDIFHYLCCFSDYMFFAVFVKRIWNIFYSLNYDEHTEPGWTLEQHTNSDITLEKIRQGGWDVVILQVYRHILGLIYKKYNIYFIFICFQEESQYTSFGEKDICNISYPFAKLLSHEIHQANPNTKVQWYLTWGRPNGDAERCDQIPQVCTFDGMNYETKFLFPSITTYQDLQDLQYLQDLQNLQDL